MVFYTPERFILAFKFRDFQAFVIEFDPGQIFKGLYSAKCQRNAAI